MVQRRNLRSPKRRSSYVTACFARKRRWRQATFAAAESQRGMFATHVAWGVYHCHQSTLVQKTCLDRSGSLVKQSLPFVIFSEVWQEKFTISPWEEFDCQLCRHQDWKAGWLGSAETGTLLLMQAWPWTEYLVTADLCSVIHECKLWQIIFN